VVLVLAGGIVWASTAACADQGPAPPPPRDPGLASGDLVLTLHALAPDDDGGPTPCRATLHIRNRSPVRVQAFALSVLVHDRDGVLVRQVSVLAMPLRPRAKTVASFPVLETGCAHLGSLRIRGFPWCTDLRGRRLDCRAAAVVESRLAVPLSF